LLFDIQVTRLQENIMNARSYLFNRAASAALIGLIVAGIALNAQAQQGAEVDSAMPIPVTLMPQMTVSASISNPSATARWRLARTRPQPATLMPTLTVTPDPYAIAAEYMADLPALASNELR
jgi:hypothetical protein